MKGVRRATHVGGASGGVRHGRVGQGPGEWGRVGGAGQGDWLGGAIGQGRGPGEAGGRTARGPLLTAGTKPVLLLLGPFHGWAC